MSAALLRSTGSDARPCGGLAMTLAGEAVVLRPSGALWLEARGVLAVADLHFEKGSAYAARGQLLPPYDTGETIARLEAEIAALRPASVVLMGDSFHDGGAEDRLASIYAARLRRIAEQTRLVWITGNHDEDGPRDLPGQQADELAFGRLMLRHEPTVGAVKGEAAGHLHPCARLVGRGRSVRRRCFVTDGERIVLPAFGAYAGGLNVRDAAFAGLFDRPPLAVALGRDRALPLAWNELGPD